MWGQKLNGPVEHCSFPPGLSSGSPGHELDGTSASTDLASSRCLQRGEYGIQSWLNSDTCTWGVYESRGPLT